MCTGFHILGCAMHIVNMVKKKKVQDFVPTVSNWAILNWLPFLPNILMSDIPVEQDTNVCKMPILLSN